MVDGSMALPTTEEIVIANSVTVAEGSAVKLVPGGVDVADATTDTVYGYVLGFIVDSGGRNLPLSLIATNTAYVDGTYSFATTGSSYAAASDNQTDKKVAAIIMPSADLVCSARLSAAGATTTGSNLVGYYSNIETTAGNRATLIDEASYTTSGDFLNVEGLSGISAYDPAETDNRRVMVRAVSVQA